MRGQARVGYLQELSTDLMSGATSREGCQVGMPLDLASWNAGLKPSSRTGRASTAGGREPTASPIIAAISAKLKAGRPVKTREKGFELEGIPHPELFTPEQRRALRKHGFHQNNVFRFRLAVSCTSDSTVRTNPSLEQQMPKWLTVVVQLK